MDWSQRPIWPIVVNAFWFLRRGMFLAAQPQQKRSSPDIRSIQAQAMRAYLELRSLLSLASRRTGWSFSKAQSVRLR